MRFQTKSIDQKLNVEQDNEDDDDDDDDDEKEDMRFLYRIRLVVGGLLLPSTIVSIDRFTFGLICSKKSTLFRTLLVSFNLILLKIFKVLHANFYFFTQFSKIFLMSLRSSTTINY